jgi:hypothetical protein
LRACVQAWRSAGVLPDDRNVNPPAVTGVRVAVWLAVLVDRALPRLGRPPAGRLHHPSSRRVRSHRPLPGALRLLISLSPHTPALHCLLLDCVTRRCIRPGWRARATSRCRRPRAPTR